MWGNFLIPLKCYLLLVGVKGDICKNDYGEFGLKDGYNKFLEPAESITIEDKQTLHNIVEVINCIFNMIQYFLSSYITIAIEHGCIGSHFI